MGVIHFFRPHDPLPGPAGTAAARSMSIGFGARLNAPWRRIPWGLKDRHPRGADPGPDYWLNCLS